MILATYDVAAPSETDLLKYWKYLARYMPGAFKIATKLYSDELFQAQTHRRVLLLHMLDRTSN
jgi:hypothetical protein